MGTHKEESKRNWGTVNDDHPTTDQLKLGCLQRIADAAEKMADGFNALLKERDHYKADAERKYQWWIDEHAKVLSRDRQISNLRGQITKLKKRLEVSGE